MCFTIMEITWNSSGTNTECKQMLKYVRKCTFLEQPMEKNIAYGNSLYIKDVNQPKERNPKHLMNHPYGKTLSGYHIYKFKYYCIAHRRQKNVKQTIENN